MSAENKSLSSALDKQAQVSVFYFILSALLVCSYFIVNYFEVSHTTAEIASSSITLLLLIFSGSFFVFIAVNVIFSKGRLVDLDQKKRGDTNSSDPETKDTDAVETPDSIENNKYQSFEVYLNNIISELALNAQIAEEKASVLLTTGIRFFLFGISLFFLSIIAWQVIAKDEMKDIHVYGVASCSLMFFLFTFFSAWHLKQHRTFTDMATYHTKIELTFAKYLLAYKAVNDLNSLSGIEHAASAPDEKTYTEAGKKVNGKIVALLCQEIKWPESAIQNVPDVSFAKEAFEAITLLTKTAKQEIKASSKRGNSESEKQAE